MASAPYHFNIAIVSIIIIGVTVVLSIRGVASTSSEEEEELAVLAVGNSDEGTAFLKVVQRDSNMTLLQAAGTRISPYCGDHQTRCRDLLVLINNMNNVTQYVSLVPLENGVWIVDLRYDDDDNGDGEEEEEMVFHAAHTLSYEDSRWRTLGIFNVSGVLYLLRLCSSTNILDGCELRLNYTNVNQSYLLPCADGLGPPLEHANLSFISNIVTVGATFEEIRLFFYIERSLYSVRISTDGLTLHEQTLPQNCDYVQSLVKETSDGSTLLIYCNNDSVYRLDVNNPIPSLLGNGSLYYQCNSGTYRLDRQTEQAIYNPGGRTISLPTLAFVSGVCFDTDRLVYLDRINGSYILEPSGVPTKLNTLGCTNGSCDIPLVFFDRYVLIRGYRHITLIDDGRSDGARDKIIDVDGVPTSLVAVISVPIGPTTTPPSLTVTTADTTGTDPTNSSATPTQTAGQDRTLILILILILVPVLVLCILVIVAVTTGISIIVYKRIRSWQPRTTSQSVSNQEQPMSPITVEERYREPPMSPIPVEERDGRVDVVNGKPLLVNRNHFSADSVAEVERERTDQNRNDVERDAEKIEACS